MEKFPKPESKINESGARNLNIDTSFVNPAFKPAEVPDYRTEYEAINDTVKAWGEDIITESPVISDLDKPSESKSPESPITLTEPETVMEEGSSNDDSVEEPADAADVFIDDSEIEKIVNRMREKAHNDNRPPQKLHVAGETDTVGSGSLEVEEVILAKPEKVKAVEVETPKNTTETEVVSDESLPEQEKIPNDLEKLESILSEIDSLQAEVGDPRLQRGTGVIEQRGYLQDKIDGIYIKTTKSLRSIDSVNDNLINQLKIDFDSIKDYWQRVQNIENGLSKPISVNKNEVSEKIPSQAPLKRFLDVKREAAISEESLDNDGNKIVELPEDSVDGVSFDSSEPELPPNLPNIDKKEDAEAQSPGQEATFGRNNVSVDVVEEYEEVGEVASAAENLMIKELRSKGMEREWADGKYFGVVRALAEMRVDDFLRTKGDGDKSRLWLSDLQQRAGGFAPRLEPDMILGEYVPKLYQGIIKAQRHSQKTGNEGLRARVLGI